VAAFSLRNGSFIEPEQHALSCVEMAEEEEVTVPEQGRNVTVLPWGTDHQKVFCSFLDMVLVHNGFSHYVF